jgi:putative ATP-binding cassette transporter
MTWGTCLIRFWGLCVGPFLRDPQAPGSLTKSLLIVAGTLGMTGATVALNLWNRSFYDALEAKQYEEFLHQIGLFSALAALYIGLSLFRLWITRSLCIQWREWATERWTTRWMSQRRFYHLELARDKADNPDQRISEDLRQCTVQSLEHALGVLTNGLALFSFVGILWSLSGSLEWDLFGVHWTIPGYMVWVAMLYAVGGSWLAHRIGRPLNQLNFTAERTEADFRANLFRIREHAESIALYGGEQAEHHQLRSRFGEIIRLWNEMTSRRMKLLAFVTGYGQAAIIFPILIAAPQYFLTAMSLGVLMQITSAFRNVNDSLSWFVDNYALLSQWRASIERLVSFWDSMEDPHGCCGSERFVRQTAQQEQLGSAEAFTVSLPCGQTLLQCPQISLGSGSRILLTGPSGSGKSTLLRAFAGLWPFGKGELHHPATGALFLPQRPYLPTGSLRHVLAFPSPAAAFDDEQLRLALDLSQMGHLRDRLDEERNWSLTLSGGEQQRLGFARVFLQKPQWLFLDESTSALDEANERLLFERLHRELPHCAVLTVAHRPHLAQYHGEQWSVAAAEQGGRLCTAPSPQLGS